MILDMLGAQRGAMILESGWYLGEYWRFRLDLGYGMDDCGGIASVHKTPGESREESRYGDEYAWIMKKVFG